MAQSFEPQPAFDSALTANSITYTVIRPVVERLVTLKPGGTEVVPHLATSCALRRYKADKLSRPAEEPGFRVVRKLHLVDTGPFELEVLAPYRPLRSSHSLAGDRPDYPR